MKRIQCFLKIVMAILLLQVSLFAQQAEVQVRDNLRFLKVTGTPHSSLSMKFGPWDGM